MRTLSTSVLFALLLLTASPSWAGQPPYGASAADIPISPRDRVYAAEQFSNTVTVVNPASNKLVGVIRMGDPEPGNLSPLYRGQVLVHGMGFSPDHRTLAVIAIGSNAVIFVETSTNTVKHVTYVGRSPHEAFFTPDGKEVWVTVRGENYVSVIDSDTYIEKARIVVPNGPGMQIFSPDGRYAYICSSFTPETVVVSVRDRTIVGRVRQASPFCPNIAATPDGKQVWFTLKDSGKVQVFNARPPFQVIRTIDTGPITNHVNFAHNAKGTFAYVTIGGSNLIRVFRTSDFTQTAQISTGDLPHGIWPSGDGSRVYVGLEGSDKLLAIDTMSNRVIASVAIGQAPQALVYVPGAVSGAESAHSPSLGVAGLVSRLALDTIGTHRTTGTKPATTVSLYDQGLTQVLEAAVTGLRPGSPYVMALATRTDGTGVLQPLVRFQTNAAGAAVVNAVGPIRQIVRSKQRVERRYLAIMPADGATLGAPVQIQRDLSPR